MSTAPVMDGRAVRTARSRQAICEACLDLIEEGVLQPSADLVCERAGVSRRSVFNHFRDLAELYDGADVDPDCGVVSNPNTAIFEEAFQPREERDEEILAAVDPQKSLRQIMGAGVPSPAKTKILPPRPTFAVRLRGPESNTIATKDRFDVHIRLRHDQTTVLDYRLPAHRVGADRFTLFYRPATPEDEELLLGQIVGRGEAGFDRIWLAGLNAIPELRVNETAIPREETRAQAVPFGAPLQLSVEYIEPAIQTPPIHTEVVAGEPVAIGLDLLSVPDRTIENMDATITGMIDTESETWDYEHWDLIGTISSAIVHAWFREIDQLNTLTSLPTNVVTHRYPSAGFVIGKWNRSSVLGLPLAMTHQGLTVDIPGDVSMVVSKDGNRQSAFLTAMISGFLGSTLESHIPGALFAGAEDEAYWMSTTDALAIASQLGSEMLFITQQNLNCALPRLSLSAEEVHEIRDAVERGFVAIAHGSPLQAKNSVQTGYVLLDPSTGSGVYRMSGGYNGGNRADCVFTTNRDSPDAAGRLLRGWAGGFSATSDFSSSLVTDVINLFAAATIVGEENPSKLNALKWLNAVHSVIRNFNANAQLYNEAAGVLGEDARPLGGLLVMLVALETINQIGNVLVPDPFSLITAEIGNSFVGFAQGTAWQTVRSILFHQARIEAASQGINLSPECLEITAN
ncbi:MAG: TetR/AcrR family transcriptional regulator [Planctomycetota bacterium]